MSVIGEVAAGLSIAKTGYDFAKDYRGRSATFSFGKADVFPLYTLVGNLYESISFDVALTSLNRSLQKFKIDNERLKFEENTFWITQSFEYEDGIASAEEVESVGAVSLVMLKQPEMLAATMNVKAFRIYLLPETKMDDLQKTSRAAFNLLRSVLNIMRENDSMRINKTSSWAIFTTKLENARALYNKFTHRLKSKSVPSGSHRLEEIRDHQGSITIQFDQYLLVELFLDIGKRKMWSLF